MDCVFWNSKSGKKGADSLARLKDLLENAELFDVATFDGYKSVLERADEYDNIYISGGDGTLNHFINESEELDIKNDIYYIPAGTGNDFIREIGWDGKTPVCINKYLKNLPSVEINGKNYKFLNGVGYGIDGYCCVVGDEMKRKEIENINYTLIAIKGLLFHYKPTNAKITVDGIEHSYKKVWLAPTMNGKYYGGGMIPTPGQDRNGDGTLSTLVYYGKGKLLTLMVFPSIFKGEHIKHKEMVEVLKGRDITVEFDKPTPLQIDGEVIEGVTKYRARSGR